MLVLLQIVLYCVLFALLVKCLVRSSGRNCLYFYPKEYIAEAHKRGFTDQNTVMRTGKLVMLPFCAVLLVALVAIIAGWNHVTDFKTAYIQSYLFLVVMNWFDGIVVDRLWVGHSKIWIVEGMEDVPYVKPWKLVLAKRGMATAAYLVIALVVAGIVVLIGKI